MSRRIVVKMSGRAFSTDNVGSLDEYARMIAGLSGQYQIVVIAGGGPIARHYISQARSSGADEATLDEIGIDVSRLNAKLLICALGDAAYPDVPATLQEVRLAAASGLAVAAGGLYPGQSTNGTAALVAEAVGARMFVNATDVDGVYDSDPRSNPGARMFKSIRIGELRGLLTGEESVAGGYDLMDMVSLKAIERSGITTRIVWSAPGNIEGAIRGADTGTLVIP